MCCSWDVQTGKASIKSYEADETEEGGAGVEEPKGTRSTAALASLMMCLAGIGTLGWWAWAFRPFNYHMWMVPLGLAMVGTPLVVLFSIAAASATFAVKF